MRPACVVCACLLMVGCVYEVPLATESQQEANWALLGRWRTVGGGGAVQGLVVR